jgi:hypothetical protein
MGDRTEVLGFLRKSDSVRISPEIFCLSIDDRFSETMVLTGRTFCRLDR